MNSAANLQKPKLAQMSVGDIYGWTAPDLNLPQMETTAINVSGGESVQGQYSNDTMSWMYIIGVLVAVNILFHFIPTE